jgi:dolichol-phosphate mannosyltransferase
MYDQTLIRKKKRSYQGITMKKLSVLIPTLNEEDAIGHVLEECHAVLEGIALQSEIIVIDGDSHDKTREIAQEKGARVILEKRKGKGIAIKTAFQQLDAAYVVMLDGDFTYNPCDMPRLLTPLQKNEADFVLGHRHFQKDSMKRLNMIGNYIITALVRTVYNIPVHDVCTGYWAFNKDVYETLKTINAQGFDLEASMLIKAFYAGFHMVEVPVVYRPRKGKAKLHPLKSGVTIVAAIVRLLHDYNPLLLFGGISAISFLIGLCLGINVVSMFQVYQTIMIGRALLTILFILISVQSLFFGMLSDMILRRDTQ